MALTIISSQRKVRSFLVYDLEWVPGSMQLRCCGVHDGKRYRAYSSIERFLDEELTSKNRGKWFYAHAGGMADLSFVLQKIIEHARKKAHFSYSVEASFSGSSAIIVHIKQGKNAWHFVDSYWLLRDKLANIAKWIGMEKGENVSGWDKMSQEDRREWYATVALTHLLIYNEQDCWILWNAINDFQEKLLALGGQLQMTLASCAMHLFRRKFLTRNIEIPAHVNEAARQAYFSSRVEVFQRECDDAFYYDINSSFPYAMTFPCPAEYIGTQRGLPRRRSDITYIADVEIEVPDSYLPPAPYRTQGRVFFPVGSWRSWLTQIDIELLESKGGKIKKVHSCMGFELFSDLKDYAEMFYTMRKNATNDFEKVTGKLLMNSLYGKFGESQEKQQLFLNPQESDEWRLRDKEMQGAAEELFPGAWIETQIADVPHMHVPIAAHITSMARRTLFNFLDKCDEVYYSDTDSVITTAKLPTSVELGGLKLEYIVNKGHFHAPKLYDCEVQNADGTSKTVLRAKGFSLGDKAEAAEKKFADIVSGESVTIERMARIRELYRRGKIKPEENIITKGIKPKILPWEELPNKAYRAITKRFMYPDGNSRPWGVEELEDILQ